MIQPNIKPVTLPPGTLVATYQGAEIAELRDRVVRANQHPDPNPEPHPCSCGGGHPCCDAPKVNPCCGATGYCECDLLGEPS